MKRYGLIGHPLKHSQSKALFEAKFAYEGLDCRYQNFDLKNVEEIHEVMTRYPDLCGFNVTIPYKEAIIPLLDELDAVAKEVGAVNVVTVRDGRLKGYNSDVVGFEKLLEEGDYTRLNKRIGKYDGIYWAIATAIYLTWSFLTMRWHATWIVWPIAGVIYAAYREILKLIVNKK